MTYYEMEDENIITPYTVNCGEPLCNKPSKPVKNFFLSTSSQSTRQKNKTLTYYRHD